MKLEETKLGTSIDGLTVIAATDSCGPQVIAFNEAHTIHLLSLPLASHEEAEKLGRRVVAKGAKVYTEWRDLNERPLTALLDAMRR